MLSFKTWQSSNTLWPGYLFLISLKLFLISRYTSIHHICMDGFRQLFSITKVGLLRSHLCCYRLWVMESSRPLTTEISSRLPEAWLRPWGSGSKPGACLPPRKNEATPRDIFGCHGWKRGAMVSWGMARGGGKHLRAHSPAPPRKEFRPQMSMETRPRSAGSRQWGSLPMN